MHLYKRLPFEQIKLILSWYESKKIGRDEALEKLGVKERRLRYLLKAMKEGSLETLGRRRVSPSRRKSERVEVSIRRELEKEKKLIENPHIPTSTYNYAHVADEVERLTNEKVSDETVRRRAKEWGFYIARPTPKKAHDRMILTDKIGTLLQHDSSHHLFAPLSSQKWYLITTLDDYSRMILYAQLCEEETAWDHILALRYVIQKFGTPANYYVDNHSIFRFVQRMESYWRTPRVDHKSVLTQWQGCLKAVGVGVFYALSPQAKGKIERPYRWMQDRLVRRCSKEEVTDMTRAQHILNEEVNRYNAHTVHSTTGEVPLMRFERSKKEKLSAFSPFELPSPYRGVDDVFCLRELRKVTGYHTVSWRGRFIEVPAHIPIGEEVLLCIIPDTVKPRIRVWYKDHLVNVVFLAPTQKAFVDALIAQEEKKTNS